MYMHRARTMMLLFALCLFAVGHTLANAQQRKNGLGINANIAYYPSYNTFELRTEEFLFSTGEGEVGLTGSYFSNPDLSGEPAFTRTDREVNFTWKNGVPENENLSGKDVSVRWTGHVGAVPKTDMYRVSVRHKGGMRVWIDEKKVIDRWEKTAGRPHV